MEGMRRGSVVCVLYVNSLGQIWLLKVDYLFNYVHRVRPSALIFPCTPESQVLKAELKYFELLLELQSVVHNKRTIGAGRHIW